MTNSLTIKTLYGGTLVPVDKVVSLLAEETDIERVSDFQKAVEAAKRIDGENGARRNYWAELAIWSTRRLGELIREGQNKGTIASGGRPKKRSHDDPVLSLADIGVSKNDSKRAQKLVDIVEDEIRAYVRRLVESEDEISKAGLVRAAGSDGTICTKHNNDVVDWYTPDKYLVAVRSVMGSIDLDPASCASAQKKVQAGIYYTAKSNGLSQDWAGNVYLNPPYKMPLVSQFVVKLCESVEQKAVAQAILLTNDNTDTSWWHRAAECCQALCFHRGRIAFYNHLGETSSPTNGQTLFYFGKRAVTFCKTFAEFGLCLQR